MQLIHYLFILILLLNFVPLSFAQDARPIVKLIYFLPRDRQPQTDINEKMDRLIRVAQQFYADQMEANGFGRKTFLFETYAHGKAVVHHVIGQHTDKYYNDLPDTWDIWEEIENRFDMSRNYYFTAIDIRRVVSRGRSLCGIGGDRGSAKGRVLIPASGNCFNVKTAAHELGHAFGLLHDFRDGVYIMSYGTVRNQISKCTAEWLDVHRAYNSTQQGDDTYTQIEMLPPNLATPSYAIRLRFKISDSDGLHQAHLLTPTLTGSAQGSNELLNCKMLHGNTTTTVEFVTTLTPKNSYVSLQVIDINGNFSRSKHYPIDVSPLLPPPEVVSIPDPNLAAPIRKSLDLAPNDAITTHTMLSLKRFTGFATLNRGITDLTGLEHAHNLTSLALMGNSITDVAPLAKLTQLKTLYLSHNSIINVAPLAELTQLTTLDLSFNDITDVAPLVRLNLTGTGWEVGLDLRGNRLSYASIKIHIPTI